MILGGSGILIEIFVRDAVRDREEAIAGLPLHRKLSHVNTNTNARGPEDTPYQKRPMRLHNEARAGAVVLIYAKGRYPLAFVCFDATRRFGHFCNFLDRDGLVFLF